MMRSNPNSQRAAVGRLQLKTTDWGDGPVLHKAVTQRAQNLTALIAVVGQQETFAVQREPQGTTNLLILLSESLVFEWLVSLNFCHYVIANSDNHVLLPFALIDIMRNVGLIYATEVVECLGSLVDSLRVPTFFYQNIDRITRFYNLTFATEAIS